MRRFIVFMFINPWTTSIAQDWFRFPQDAEPVWVSFENPRGERGAGGHENRGAKGHPAEEIAPGETKVLLNFEGAGIVNRIWITVSERSPIALRSLRLEMTWDGADRPAVAAPLGDFFGIGLGRRTPFENALFSDPEGRSFNCAIPMPFRKGARITLTNESAKSVTLFYDVNLTRVKQHADDVLYFHAHWNHNGGTKLGEDFEILPALKGRGRFLGCNLGIVTDPIYGKSWFGEGEVKIFLDGDRELASLVGTGTEDYIGTAWGQGAFVHQFQGCPVADEANRQWAFYRYHIPDPVYFQTGCRVTIQQMGGDMSEKVREYAAAGAALTPVTVSTSQGMLKLLELPEAPKISDAAFPAGWTNFYRLDNYSATAYFYLDSPSSDLPPLAPLEVRLRGVLAK
jgi:hypothetical protein